jgi:putative membrane protein insertion efficiency factor
VNRGEVSTKPHHAGAGLYGAGALALLPRYAGIGLVWAWRLTFGALFPTTCKYEPSCSEYAIQAVRKHGLVKGSALAGWRLLRCNPWSHGGHDPVR